MAPKRSLPVNAISFRDVAKTGTDWFISADGPGWSNFFVRVGLRSILLAPFVTSIYGWRSSRRCCLFGWIPVAVVSLVLPLAIRRFTPRQSHNVPAFGHLCAAAPAAARIVDSPLRPKRSKTRCYWIWPAN